MRRRRAGARKLSEALGRAHLWYHDNVAIAHLRSSSTSHSFDVFALLCECLAIVFCACRVPCRVSCRAVCRADRLMLAHRGDIRAHGARGRDGFNQALATSHSAGIDETG